MRMRRGSTGIQMGMRGGDMEKREREKKNRDKSKFNYYQWRDLQKINRLPIFRGLCEIKAPYKMDGVLPLAFYPPVKLKIPLAQSRDEQITSMCHFMPTLDTVCLTSTDVHLTRSGRVHQ